LQIRQDGDDTMSASAYPDRDGRVFFDLARDRLSVQLETLDAIDNKIGMLFSVSTGMLGILAAVLALRSGKLLDRHYVLVGVSVVAYLIVAFHSRRAYAAKEWHAGGDLTQTWRMYTESDESDRRLEWKVANRIRLDLEDNKDDLKSKLRALDWLFPALVIQTLSLLATLVLVAA
jgi:hypothetical protein